MGLKRVQTPDTSATRPPEWPDDADVRRAVTWFKQFVEPTEWNARREAVARHFYESALGQKAKRPNIPARFFSEDDVAGWYLFLAEAYIDHIGDYEPAAGARVIPLFKSLGRDLDLLLTVQGAQERGQRFLTDGRKQPDAGLFELLVALAYRRQGWPTVRFVPEQRGGKRTADLECTDGRLTWSIECKRLGRSKYAWRERNRFWELWRPIGGLVAAKRISLFVDMTFHEELFTVPETYIAERVAVFLRGGGAPYGWSDHFAEGNISWLDLQPLKSVLETDAVVFPSQRLFELLTGEYQRYASYASFASFKPWAMNPRYIDQVECFSLARWRCLAEKSVDTKARHVLKHVAEANRQLSPGRPGVIHVGLEPLEGDHVELVRHPKIVNKLSAFDPEGSGLAWIYCHYFVPESPPDQSWAFDETTLHFSVAGKHVAEPLSRRFLVLPDDIKTQERAHWQR